MGFFLPNQSIPFSHTDIDILDPSNPDAFKLSEYARLEQVARTSGTRPVSTTTAYNSIDNFQSVGVLVKRLLAHCWDPMLLCLAQGLDKKFTFQTLVHVVDHFNPTYIGSLCAVFDCDNKHSLAQCKNVRTSRSVDAWILIQFSSLPYQWNISIQTGQALFSCSRTVGFYDRLDTIYELLNRYLVKYCTQDRTLFTDIKLRLRRSTSSTEVPNVAVPTPSSSSMDRVNFALSLTQVVAIKSALTNASSVGNHCARVWRHVFDLCKFVTELECLIFRSARSSLLSRARSSINTILKSNSMSFSGGFGLNTAPSHSHPDHYQNLYDFNVYNAFPGINEVEYSNLESNFEVITREIRDRNFDMELKVEQT